MRNRDVGHPPDDHLPLSFVMILDPRRYIFLHTGHIVRGQKMTVRQIRNILHRPADPRKFLYVGIPWLYLLIPHRPVDPDPVPRIGREIEIAPAITLTPPH